MICLHQYIDAASTVPPIYWCYDVRSTNILVLLVLAAPIGEDTLTFRKLKNFADFLHVSSTNILVQYKEN
jgi:hypothetical protein